MGEAGWEVSTYEIHTVTDTEGAGTCYRASERMIPLVLLVVFGVCWVAALAMTFDSWLLNLLTYVIGVYALYYATVEYIL